MVSGTGYATYTVLAKRMLRLGHAPERVMAASFSLGALLLAPVLALGDLRWLATGDGLAMALFLGAIPTALAYILFARGLQAPDAGRDGDADARRAADRDRPRRRSPSASGPARSRRSAPRSCSPACSRSRCRPRRRSRAGPRRLGAVPA